MRYFANSALFYSSWSWSFLGSIGCKQQSWCAAGRAGAVQIEFSWPWWG